MKFISSLELIESPVEKLVLKGLTKEITALRSNLRTSVISDNKKMMNDIRDAKSEVQLNGQVKHSSEVSNQVKNALTFNTCDLTVKKVIIPAEWEKKLAECSSIDSNGVLESSRMAPGFTTHKVNNVYLESNENSGVPKEESSMEIEALQSKTVLDIRSSSPEQSRTETSNGQLDNITNGNNEWSNEASNSAGEESLSINYLPHTLATNVTNDCSATMPLQIESCSTKNIEYDLEMDENSTFLGIQVRNVEACDSQENELENEVENSKNLNSAFAKEQLNTTFENKINNIRQDDQVSELDMAENCQENVLAENIKVITDGKVNPTVESKEESGDSRNSDNLNTVKENEFEEKTEIYNFCDKLAANTMHNNTDEIQASNDFSSISSDGSNSKLADIVDDLDNMESLQASNVEFDNACDAVDQSDNLDELNSEIHLEIPDAAADNGDDDDDDDDDDMSGLNDFVEASTENCSEIDIHDNIEDLENVEGCDIDTAMDVNEEIENGNSELEIDKSDEHDDTKIDELMDTEEDAGKTDKVEDAEGVVNETTELPDSEEVLDKTSELGDSERDEHESYELVYKSPLSGSGESARAEEWGEIGDLEGSGGVVVDETYELRDEVPSVTSSEPAISKESREFSKPEESEKILNEVPLGTAAESGECEMSVNDTNELLHVASSDKTNESSNIEETIDKDSELSKEIELIKADVCVDAETTLSKDGELADEISLDDTNELNDTKEILDRTGELSNKTTEMTTLSGKTEEPANDEETLDEAMKVVDEPMLDKTDKLDHAEAILDKPDELMDEVELDQIDESDGAVVMLDKSDELMEKAEDKTDELDNAEIMQDRPDKSALSKTDDAEATLDKSDETLDEAALGKTNESMDAEETEDIEGGVEAASEEARKEENVSEPNIAKTPKENEQSPECENKDKLVGAESVDSKEKVFDVDSKAVPDSAAPVNCLESKSEKDANVTADKLGVKRLLSEDEVTTEVKRTKVDKEECTLETEDISNSEAEAKEVNEEVFRTAGKRLSEPVEVGEAKKPRLELGSEISDGAVHVDMVHDSDHSSQLEDKNKVESESKSKEEVSGSDKVTDSTKNEKEPLHIDSKASSEAAPVEKDASESKKKESENPDEAASKTDKELEKPSPPKQMSNLDLAIERVVAAAAAAAEAAEAAETTAIDIDDDDDDDEVVETSAKSSDPKKLYSLPFMDKLHSNVVKKMGRNELEEFVMQKVCEVLTERSQLGRLRQQVQALEEQNESWRKKTQMLQKQLKDLDLVMKRFVNDSRMKRDRPFPVKVTRSVGLQVHMPSNGLPQAGKQRSGDSNARSQPIHRRRNRPSQNTSQSTQNAQQSQPTTTTAATSTSTTTTSTTTVQQTQPPTSQPQPPQTQASTVQQQQQPTLAQIVNAASIQQNARSPVCSTATVQKVVAPTLAKMGTTATIVSPRASTPNLVNTAVKLPVLPKQPVPIRPAITTVSTQNTMTTVNSTAGSLSTGLRVASASQLNSRTIRSGVTNSLSPVSKASDSKVIDLTDEDDKSKLNIVRFPNSSTTTPVSTTVVTTATTGVHSGAIRVVHPHQLTGNTTTILTAGNQQQQSRFAYIMPSSGSPGQQRQVLIATSAAQVRPGIVTMSSRPTMSPTTFLLKNGSMLPIQQPSQAQAVTNAAAILRPATSIQQPGALQTVRAGQPVRVSPSLVGRIPTTNMPIAPALSRQHPAPLPTQPICQPSNPLWKCAPPKPDLKTSRVSPNINNKQPGIVLSWNMRLTSEYEEIASYQLFAYQEGPAPPNTSLWKKVGDVKALPLPMACTLTQFTEGNKYHFAVRAVDVHSRVGPFSAPRNIVLTRK